MNPRLNQFIKVSFWSDGKHQIAKGFWHSGSVEHSFKLADAKDGPPTQIFYKATVL